MTHEMALRIVQAEPPEQTASRIVELYEVIERYDAALHDCEIEIDNYIDSEYPADSHPRFAAKNGYCKKHNSARLALGGQTDE